ncbi:MAG: recombinase family protein [Nitrospirae bacterium]|nr:recombinase family protein [Nitrospirota bacterium]
MKIAAIYARVSTDRQEDEATMESQLDALHRYASEHEYRVDGSREYTDVFTGSRLDRPGLERLRDDVYEGKLEAILAYAPDRLARQFPYQVILLEEFRRAGVEIVFLNRTYSDRSEDQMLLQIQGVFSEYERKLIAERTRRGRIYLARQGRITSGRAPYGYRTWKRAEGGGGLLKVYEPEAEVAREIYRWLVEEELSLGRIAHRLTERAVPTQEGKTRWHVSGLTGMVKNSVYKGLRYYNVLTTVDTPPARPRGAQSFKDLRPGIARSRRKRPPAEWIPVPAPALVSEEIWEKAQKQIEKNRTWNPGHATPGRYLLKSLLVCGACGRRMHGLTSTRTPHYRRYLCTARYPSYRPDRCAGASLPHSRWKSGCGTRCDRCSSIRRSSWSSTPEATEKHPKTSSRIRRSSGSTRAYGPWSARTNVSSTATRRAS